MKPFMTSAKDILPVSVMEATPGPKVKDEVVPVVCRVLRCMA